MRNRFRTSLAGYRLAVVALAIMVVSGGAFAVAANKITGKDIKKNAIASKHIKNGSIKAKDLNKKVRNALNQAGAAGPAGPQGPQGPGLEYQGEHWGLIDRNTVGSPVAALRTGPYVGADQAPPLGIGSLGLSVEGVPRTDSNNAEQVTFGNEVDFVGDPVADINELEYWVYTTGENNGRGNPNMPTLKFEINPDLDTNGDDPGGEITYSTLTFQPPNSAANEWSLIEPLEVAPGPGPVGFFLSGAAGTETDCRIGNPCSLDDVKAALGENASILTVGIGKGRDNAFSGAVDALRINGTVYDFEPNGVIETQAN